MNSAPDVPELEAIARFWGHAYTFSHDPGTCPGKPYTAPAKTGRAPYAPPPWPSCSTPSRTTPPPGPSPPGPRHEHAAPLPAPAGQVPDTLLFPPAENGELRIRVWNSATSPARRQIHMGHPPLNAQPPAAYPPRTPRCQNQ
jgi:hypothetical protein